MRDLIYELRNSNIKFCLDQSFPMMYIDMGKMSLWRRLFKKKEFVLWDEDIEALREFIKLYDEKLIKK